MDDQLIEVKYKCNVCNIERPVNVKQRARAVDIVAWVNMVGRHVAVDHTQASPACTATHFDLMIPVSDNSKMVGRIN